VSVGVSPPGTIKTLAIKLTVCFLKGARHKSDGLNDFVDREPFLKAQREVDEFRRFQRLSAELIAVNEKICRLRPVEEEAGMWTAEEKKRLLRSIRRRCGK